METEPKLGGTLPPLWKIPYFFFRFLLNPSLSKYWVGDFYSKTEGLDTPVFCNLCVCVPCQVSRLCEGMRVQVRGVWDLTS